MRAFFFSVDKNTISRHEKYVFGNNFHELTWKMVVVNLIVEKTRSVNDRFLNIYRFDLGYCWILFELNLLILKSQLFKCK